MGRKIPGRKHRGVRDPEKQRQERLNSIKNKINAPPSDPDDQQVPKSLMRIMELKNKVKDGTISLKKKHKHKKSIPVTSHPGLYKKKIQNEHKIKNKAQKQKGKITDEVEKHREKLKQDLKYPVKTVPVFTQNKNESDRAFLNRVNKTCESVLKEAAFENKFNVDVIRNEKTGKVEKVVKRKPDELEEIIKRKRKEMKNPKLKKRKEKQIKEKLTKSQKKKLKLKEKKEKRKNQNDDFDVYRDNVGFGEVVHEPPSLPKLKKVPDGNGVLRPGLKNLLLKKLIEGKDLETKEKGDKSKSEANIKKIANKVIDKKGKRKTLPAATRRQLEKQQQEVIEAYRKLKVNKNDSVV